MNPFNNVTNERINVEVQQILSTAGTPQCAVWGERRGVWRFRKTFRSNGTTSNENDDADDITTYCIGSIGKIFVATATIILIDQLALTEDTKYEPLQDAWKHSISKHLDIMVRRQHGPDPTISHLLYHVDGPPSMNDFILGPDGTVLLSKDKFLTTANKIIKEIHSHTSEHDYGWRYNNVGYILAGLLIEKYSGLTLGEFLKQTLFIPLGMNFTYATTRDFEALGEEHKAAANVVSASGQAHRVERPMYFDETVALAAAGIYSCTKDLALFSQKVLDVLANGDKNGAVNFRTATRLCHPRWVFGDGSPGVYTYCGFRTTLDTTVPGSHSPNRVVSPPPSPYSCYSFGTGQDSLPVEVIYHGGSVTGYECSFYLLPKSDTFVIALSNATGLVDTSDHVSRLLLQELLLQTNDSSVEPLLQQKESPELYNTSQQRIKKRLRPSRSLSVRVDIVEMARGGAQARRILLQHYQDQPAHLLLPLNLPRPCSGHYVSRAFRQSIFIEDNGDDTFAISFGGDAAMSGRFKLLQTSDHTATVVPFEDAGSAVLGNDVLGDWKDLDLVIRRDSGGRTVTFSRARIGNVQVNYRYVEKSSESVREVFPFDDVHE